MQAVDEQCIRRHAEAHRGQAHRAQAGAQDVDALDLARLDSAHCVCDGTLANFIRELLTLITCNLLAVAEPVRHALVVQHDGGSYYRARQGTTSDLIAADDDLPAPGQQFGFDRAR